MVPTKALRSALILAFLWVYALPALADCPPFFLRTEKGETINPFSGENADQPYSPKQTCGLCHDYAKITQGYHFQQGLDQIDDRMGLKKGMPWVFSPGMMGKW